MSGTLSLAEGAALARISISELWERYFAIGGTADAAELSARIDDDAVSDHEHNLIAQALNEVFLDRGEDHPVAYRPRPADNGASHG